MHTFTPHSFTLTDPAHTIPDKPSGIMPLYIDYDRIVLFTGPASHALPEETNGFQYILAEDVEHAGKVVAQLLNNFRKIPAVIIYSFNSAYEKGFAEWQAYFARHQVLKTIPFLLYAEQVTPSLRSLCRSFTFIDEIVTRDCLINDLDKKVSFISRYKRMQVFSSIQEQGVKPRYRKSPVSSFLKRSFDVTVAGTALLALSPVMLAIALLIKMESKGPVFYRSPRAGRNYRIFKFYKFRTMVPDADKQLDKLKHLNQYGDNNGGAVFYKVSNDPRVTRLGNFLRNSSLDEIPQLFNVLKGDMSLVGNRPLPLYEATTLTTDQFVERFLAPAGITGLWQISKRGKKEMSAEERINLDINYTHKNSFAYDLWLMANTPFAMMQKDNV